MPKPRRKGNKIPKPTLRIFCEGEKSEPNYINGYLKEHSTNRLSKVIKVQKTKKNTPAQLVEEAIKKKNDRSSLDKDTFWVVYDRESAEHYTDDEHKEVLDEACRNKIKVALTNICFEVWLILHFTESNRPFTSYKDLLKNSELKSELKNIGLDNYLKADVNLFDLIKRDIPKARERAVKMNKATLESTYHDEDKPYLLNPYTGMHYLLDDIDKFINGIS